MTRQLFVMKERYNNKLRKILVLVLAAATVLWITMFIMHQYMVRESMACGSSRIVYGSSSYTRPDKEHLVTDEETKIEYIDNELLAMKKEDVPEKEFEAYLEKNHIDIAGKLSSLSLYQLRLNGEYTYGQIEKIGEDMLRSGMAETAGPNITCGIISGNRQETEPEAGTDEQKSISWGLQAADVEQAWNLTKEISGKINVGVLDTGFYTEHEDLEFTEPPLANSLYDENGMPESHGTHVAGIIGASLDEENGICGVIPRDQRNLYGASVFGMRIDRDRVDLMGLGTALSYLIRDKNCKVVNLSLICFGKEEMTEEMYGENPNAEALTPRLEELLEAFLDRGSDFVICKAAGNQEDVDAACDPFAAINSPRVKDRIIVTGAAAREDGELSLADYSSPGTRVDLTAPGGSGSDIVSTGMKQGIFRVPKSGFVGMSGTSMAAPYVSGTAALVWLADPDLTGDQVKEILCDTADISLENCSQWNMLDAAEAVETALNTDE